MSLKAEIEQLKEQIEHIEGAIADLGKSTPAPKGNDFARVLAERFDKIDDDEQRAKSREAAQTVLAEAKRSLEAKEREFKAALREFSSHKHRLQIGATRVNQLSMMLQKELLQLQRAAVEAKETWRTVCPGDVPLTQPGHADIVLPCATRSGEGFGLKHFNIDQYPNEPFSMPQYRYRLN